MPIESLTVKERILLHLFDYTRFTEEFVAPFEVTQSGISEAVGIRVQHVRQNVRPMIQNELVVESTRHVQRGTRRRKAYFLTSRGRMASASLRRVLLREDVPFRSKDGIVATTSLLEVSQSQRRGSPLLKLLEEFEATGRIGELAETGAPDLVELTDEMPPVDSIYGREEELGLVLGLAEEKAVTAVTGIAGIGKTTLGAEVCNQFRGERSLFWRRIRPWDTAMDLSLRMASFLKLLHRRALHGYLVGTQPAELSRVADMLVSDLMDVRAFLVFDDVHNVSPDAANFLTVLLESLSRVDGSSAVFLSRVVPEVYSRREVEIEGTVAEVALGALSPKHSRAILQDEGVDESAWDRFVEAGGGNPLFLKLLSRSGQGSDVKLPSSLTAYFAEEIEPSLQDEEHECLEIASFYEVPVPAGGLLLGRRGGTRTIIDLQRRGLIDEVAPGTYKAHDLVREYFRQGLPLGRRDVLSERVGAWLTKQAGINARTGDPQSAIAFLQNAVMLETTPDRLLPTLQLLGAQRDVVGDLPGAITAYKTAATLTTDVRTQAMLHSQIAICHTAMRSFDEAQREIDEGLNSLPPEPSISAGWLLLARSRNLFVQSKADLSVKALNKLAGWTTVLAEDPNLRGWVHLMLGMIYTMDHTRRDLALARAELQESLDPLRDGGDRRGMARAHEHLARVAVALGRQEEVTSHIEQCRRLAVDFGDDVVRFRARRLKADQIFRSGDLEAAEKMYQEVLRLAQQTHQEFSAAYSPENFANVYRFQGRYEEAREAMEYLFQTTEGLIEEPERIWFLSLAVRICAMSQDLDLGSRYLAEGEELLAQNPDAQFSLVTQWARADLQAARGDVEAAESSFLSVREVLPKEPFGLEHEDVEFLLDFGRFLASIGASRRAKKLLTEALEEAKRRRDGLLAGIAEEALNASLLS